MCFCYARATARPPEHVLRAGSVEEHHICGVRCAALPVRAGFWQRVLCSVQLQPAWQRPWTVPAECAAKVTLPGHDPGHQETEQAGVIAASLTQHV